MSKGKGTKKKSKKQPVTPVTLLAYFHRYGWLALLILIRCIAKSKHVLSVGLILYAVWTFLGYIFRWKHIFCSYQNACHQPMTPNDIRWNLVKRSDAYGVPALFLLCGVALLLFWN